MMYPKTFLRFTIVIAILAASQLGGAVSAEEDSRSIYDRPNNVSIVIEFEDLDTMRISKTWTFGYEGWGEESEFIRVLLDQDTNGDVTRSEVDAYLDHVNSPLEIIDSVLNLTLDGAMPLNRSMVFHVEGGEGPVDRDDGLNLTLTHIIRYPEPGDNETHTFAQTGDGTNDTFIGGDEAWMSEFIGGNEPWDGKLTWQEEWYSFLGIDYSINCPEGWRFDTTDWPWYFYGNNYGLNFDRTKFKFNGTGLRALETMTFGLYVPFTIKKFDDIDIRPSSIDYHVSVVNVRYWKTSMSATFDGESASALLSYLDFDDNGDYDWDDYNTAFNLLDDAMGASKKVTDILLLGQHPRGTTMDISFTDPQYINEFGNPIGIEFTERLEFNEPTRPGPHTYAISDSTEFIGGIDLWDPAFMRVDDPWDRRLVQDGDAWAEGIDTTFMFSVSDGWEIQPDGWPAGLDDFLSIDDTRIEIGGADFRSSYNSTFGALDSITIVEREILPSHLSVEVEFENASSMSLTIAGTYIAKDAYFFQRSFDDGSGTASEELIVYYLQFLNERMAWERAEVNITLDGWGPDSIEREFLIEGAEGLLDGAHIVTITFHMTVLFPVREDATSFTYDFGDFPDFISGDGLWDDTFPFDEDVWNGEFMRGDEAWDDRVDVLFQVRAPRGYIFDTEGWHSRLRDFLIEDGTLIEMDGTNIRSSFAVTMAPQDTLTLVEPDSGDDTPGFGVVNVAAVMVLLLLVYRRRDR